MSKSTYIVFLSIYNIDLSIVLFLYTLHCTIGKKGGEAESGGREASKRLEVAFRNVSHECRKI